MNHHIYVVTKENNFTQYVIREIPLTPDVDEEVYKAMHANNYICHFVTSTPPEHIVEEQAPYFKGLTLAC